MMKEKRGDIMKHIQYPTTLCLLAVLLLCLPVTAGANSSWFWISETRPYDVLPYVVAGTLLMETLGIWRIPGTKGLMRVFCLVCLGNLVSFAMPYLDLMFDPISPFDQALDSYFFTVGASYLVMTLVAEVPILYFGLRKHTAHRKRLLPAIIGCNVVTTVAVAVVERTVCQGGWA